MNGAQLKNSILQWAIQGKLVPQNPKDEPASKLLERIAASRNESTLSLSKGAKSKKSAPTSRIYRENGVWYEQLGNAEPKDISEDVPFEIPESWVLCRVKDICSKITDGTHHSPKNTDDGDYKYVTAKNIKEYGIQLTNISYVEKKVHDEIFARCNPSFGDILYIKDGATTGICCINNLEEPFSLLSSVALLKPKEEIFTPYLLYFLRSPACYDSVRESMKGTGITRITLTKIEKWIIPLPPLAEQKRIVAKLEKVLPLVDEYNVAQEQLDKLNKELPEALKKSILQQAIQGKLVPQNPKDEPAQKLLERIAASRNESSLSLPKGTSSASLRGAKATKQSKNPPSRIYRENGTWYEQIGNVEPKDISDEIPFEIPETWAWCRLGNCSDYAASKEKAKSFENIQEMWSLDLEDIEKNSGRIVKRLKVCERKIVGEKVVFKKGQVLYSKLRPYLKKILVAPEDGVCSSEIVPFSPFEYLDADYLVTVLKSPHVDYTINLVTYGVKMPRVGTDTMLNLLIPLPPLAEQKRIVAKLEQLFKVL